MSILNSGLARPDIIFLNMPVIPEFGNQIDWSIMPSILRRRYRWSLSAITATIFALGTASGCAPDVQVVTPSPTSTLAGRNSNPEITPTARIALTPAPSPSPTAESMFHFPKTPTPERVTIIRINSDPPKTPEPEEGEN